MLDESLKRYIYRWPDVDMSAAVGGQFAKEDGYYKLTMPEKEEVVAADSRWPAIFPVSISLVSTGTAEENALEKVVGVSIVNRFPYVLALNFCKEELSHRHHRRKTFMEMLEADGHAAIQFLPTGPPLDRAMDVIHEVPESETRRRVGETGLSVHPAESCDAPVFDDAYMVYEARMVKPSTDFEGNPIYEQSWIDVGSHRIYFMEITTIQLRRDIAEGRGQVQWRSLPAWNPRMPLPEPPPAAHSLPSDGSYKKSFNPYYKFPAENTVVFEADEVKHGMAVKHLPPLPEDQVEVDNDRAKWPCFFPSSLGMITSRTENGEPNLMPCGSTFVVSRYPMVIAPCISYAAINERYAPRVSLEQIRKSGVFGCSIPFIDDRVLEAINYAGNLSMRKDPEKLLHSGLRFGESRWGPVLPDLPVFYGCRVIGEVKLGTHIMFLGEVEEVRVREDVTPDNAVEWCPWAAVPPKP